MKYLLAMLSLLGGGYSMAGYNLERMKKLAELSNVPIDRILKFQLQESYGGSPKYMAGDQGFSLSLIHI